MSSTRDFTTESNRALSSSLTILETLKMDGMLHVMAYLSVRDLVRSQRVSKAWSDLVLYKLSRIRLLTTRSVLRNKFFTTTSLRHLLMKIGPGLHCLEIIEGTYQLDNTTPHLIAELCPNLQKLFLYKLKDCNWNVRLVHLKDLKSLFYRSCQNVTDSLLSLFAPMLEEVRIIDSYITGSFLLNYQTSHLKKLELSECEQLQPSLLCETVGRMKQLTSLTINSPSEAMSARLHDVLLQLPQLQEFSCCNNYNEEGSLAPLAAMKDLHVLNLYDNMLLNDQLLKYICVNCTRLQALYIESCIFNPWATLKTPSYVWMLPELEKLKADNMQLPPSSAAANSFKLKELHCATLELGDVQRIMTLCPKLSVLNISYLDTDLVCFVQEVVKAVKLQPGRTNYLTLRLREDKFNPQHVIKEVNQLLRDCRLVKVFWKLWRW